MRRAENSGAGGAAAESTKLAVALDEAIVNVSPSFPGWVHAGIKIEASARSEFLGGGPHLTNAGDTRIAQALQ